MTATTRDVRKLAAEIVKGNAPPATVRIVDAIDWAVTRLAGSTDLFHETNEELRRELEVASLAMWASGRSQEEIVAVLLHEASA